jgi:hypothetical protein
LILDTNALSAFDGEPKVGAISCSERRAAIPIIQKRCPGSLPRDVAPVKCSGDRQKIFAGRKAPPSERMQRRSTAAARAVLEITIETGPKRRARRIRPAFAGSISVGTDEPVRVARQIYGRRRSMLVSCGFRHCRRRQQRGDARCRQDHFQVCSHVQPHVSPGSHPASVSYATLRIAQEVCQSRNHHEILLGSAVITIT